MDAWLMARGLIGQREIRRTIRARHDDAATGGRGRRNPAVREGNRTGVERVKSWNEIEGDDTDPYRGEHPARSTVRSRFLVVPKSSARLHDVSMDTLRKWPRAAEQVLAQRCGGRG